MTGVRVAVTGLGVRSAFGAGIGPLLAAAAHGRPGFGPVDRFDVTHRQARRAALAPGSPVLGEALTAVLAEAADQAGVPDGPLLLARHGDPVTAAGCAPVQERWGSGRVYTGACVAAGTAVADAAALITAGQQDRVLVAAGYLVEPDTFAVFDAGRALARDGEARPFSAGRSGLLLGDGVVAVVLESEAVALRRGAEVLAVLAGWGRAGDGYHVCRPAPDGSGLARAIRAALGRADLTPDQIGYVNANATGSPLADQAEVRALHTVFGPNPPPVSSSKSVHGHALEASALLELAVTVESLRTGLLPVNAGWLGPDPDCALDLVLTGPYRAGPRYALSLNSAFGGANTALLVAAA
ncbi:MULTISPECIES: beta-ketoacyl synthase [unclassified Kitasatospora]|uniref:beta-ketoacyl-[acyl-carrier-protein] synthase family protein n=1 Tax=unclassified Kitasatospora TaxID=2633591 RepID=UPI00070AED19|nr:MULTISPECIES: beta-ketoacyl synthase N-terminal-like domain-containing protein [unclassified Kitasatospora]KQV12057.1 3-ketoacyl-ACP synthase [Kitasatospora sp. Root107]KRB72599.1 3-ketoacyl-ACP synthase [Kitasatospora sp. Root187]